MILPGGGSVAFQGSCEIKYLGDNRWKVIYSEGTRIAVGDTFNCSVIMSGEPLYVDNLVHDGKASGVYVCGIP